jgi:hypothetical protein
MKDNFASGYICGVLAVMAMKTLLDWAGWL